LPYSAFDKLQRVSHAAIVENKRLGEVLAWIKEQQDRQPGLNTIPDGPRRSSQKPGILKNRARRTVCRSRRRFDSRMSCTALFRWIELNYGLFQAFGAVGALLLVAAAICAALAVSSVKRGPRQFPSLTSRLRVAIASNPLHSDQNPTAENIPSAVLFAACGKVR
jgi:hypothetical protein